MQKVIIVAEWLKPGGGVTRSLIQLLRSIDPTAFDVTLFVMRLDDELVEEIPAHVRVVGNPSNLQYLPPHLAARGILSEYGIWSTIAFALSFVRWKITGNRRARCAFFTKRNGKLPRTYDVAVAYAMLDSYSNQFVADCITADQRIMWCHINYQLYADQAMGGMGQVYARFDRINCVGKSTLESLASAYPALKDRLRVTYNLVDRHRIEELANEEIEGPRPQGTLICTVARLTREKGIDLLIEAAALLKSEGYEFTWWVVGPKFDPVYSIQLEGLLAKHDVSDQIRLLGQRLNPYPFMAACDIYVQPSRLEGYCGASVEAKTLGKPVI